MVIENVNVYDLIPFQIEEIINKLRKALVIVKGRKQTVSKVASYEKKEHQCFNCGSHNIVKNGHTKAGIQTYKCKECGKKFNDLTNTVFSGTHLSYEQIETFIQCFRDKVSLRKTAVRMNVDKKTVHLLRLKILNSLSEIRQNTKLSGEIECDELYRTINLKGTKPDKMPRASKPRSSKGTTTQGISKHKVCIASAIDENDNCFLEIVGTGPITSEMVKKSLTPKMGNVRKLITDCKSSYESESRINNWDLKQIKSGSYIDDEGNSLANINSLHSGLSTFLAPFRGVSTKHQQGYLDWYTFERFLNYAFVESNQYERILNHTMNNSTNINESNVYNNYSGINFDIVYADYNYPTSS